MPGWEISSTMTASRAFPNRPADHDGPLRPLARAVGASPRSDLRNPRPRSRHHAARAPRGEAGGGRAGGSPRAPAAAVLLPGSAGLHLAPAPEAVAAPI